MKFSRFLLLAVIGMLVSCNSNLDQPDTTEQTPEEFSIIGTIEPITRLAYIDSDNYMECHWEIGDKVDISSDKITHHFIVSKLADDNRAILTYDGTRLPQDKDFVGKATYRVDAPDGQIVQAANGVVSGNSIYGKDNATAHLKLGETLVADVKGLTSGMEIVFRHTESSAYRIVVTAPVDFNPGEATLKMTIDDISSEIKLGFGAKKGETIVAYMLGKEATLLAGNRLEFTLRKGKTEYVYCKKVSNTADVTFSADQFWIANLKGETPEVYETVSIEDMTLEEKVGQLFIVHPERLNGGKTTCTAINNTMKNNLQKYKVGGVILFGQNIINPTQTKQLISDIKQYSKYTPFIAVDEEGGSVARVAGNSNFGYTNVGNMRYITSESAAREAGDYIGSYLKTLGFNLDFAPVADVDSNPNNTVIGKRSFSSDAYVVAPMVRAYIDGLHNHGILSTMKHFPGHGDTSTDSHTTLPMVSKTWAQLLALEIIPFAYNFDKTDLVMTAHIAVTSVNEKLNGYTKPSTLSYNMITGKLRNELGYDGIVTTDALQMAGITNFYSDQGEAAVQAILAGCDIILCPSTFLENNTTTIGTYHAVLNAVKSGRISEARLNQSVERILAKKNRIH